MVRRARPKLRTGLLRQLREDRAAAAAEERLLGDLAGAALNRRFNTWRVMRWHFVIIAAWCGWNVLGPLQYRFDPWPFIGENLVLSMEGALAAVVIGIAANAGMRVLLGLIREVRDIAAETRAEHVKMQRTVTDLLAEQRRLAAILDARGPT